MCIRDSFKATVRLHESEKFEIVPGSGDLCCFDTLAEFLRDVKLMGYYGGMRLVKAAIKTFHEYCHKQHIRLRHHNFTISYESDIPRLVGLAGSSGIVCAVMRAMMQFYQVAISNELLPSLILAAEKDELRIQAGLQDRVIQTYEGIVYMDFERAYVEKHGHGKYELLNPPKLPPLY